MRGRNRQRIKTLQKELAMKTSELKPVKIAHKIADFVIHHLPHLTKKTTTLLVLFYVLISGAYMYYGTAVSVYAKQATAELSAVKQQLSVIESKDQEDQKLGNYILNILMKMYNVRTNPVQQQVIAQAIVRVTGSIFGSYEERKWMAVIVANESGFNKNAKSSAGAVGLAQVMPQFAEEFGAPCGLTNIDKNDVADMEINLIIGACRFKALLASYEGEVTSAVAAYNAGKSAKSLKELQSLTNITNTETVNYITKFAHVKSRADIQEKKGEAKERSESPQASVPLKVPSLASVFEDRINQ